MGDQKSRAVSLKMHHDGRLWFCKKLGEIFGELRKKKGQALRLPLHEMPTKSIPSVQVVQSLWISLF